MPNAKPSLPAAEHRPGSGKGAGMKITHRSRAWVATLALLSWQNFAAADAEQHYQLDVPPQRLTMALKEFAQQTKLQVIYYTDIAQGIASPGASGSLSAHDALNRLLSGTGLEFVFVNERTVAI